MPKFYVIHGSVALAPKRVPLPDGGFANELRTAGTGEVVELTDAQAKSLLENGYITDEKTFRGMVQMVEGATAAGGELDLSEKLQKFSQGLKDNAKRLAELAEEEAAIAAAAAAAEAAAKLEAEAAAKKSKK